LLLRHAVIASVAKQSRGAYQILAPRFWMIVVMVAFDGRGKPSSLQDLILRDFFDCRTGLLRYARNDGILAISPLS